MKIKNCRICNSQTFEDLFTLGKLAFTGKFAKQNNFRIPNAPLNLVMCKKCKLVQLDSNFNPRYLYSEDYGYRTGINKTMTNHVKEIVIAANKIVKLKKNDKVLDIASNDATLLSYYKKNLIRVGIDPLINKYKNFYKNIDFKISEFFSYHALKKKKINFKFKVISALSMFYDLKNPGLFLKNVKKSLDIDGIFILEHADLLSIVKNCLFDTICHEHLEYYSSKIIVSLMEKNSLRVFDIRSNDINGGSMCYFICHHAAKFKSNKKKIEEILKIEKKFKLENKKTFKNFFLRINDVGKKLNNLINSINFKKQKIHGYGASTKGNVLLQYFKISNKSIEFVSDRNPLKIGLYTPGTKIKIISEENSRKMMPDYYLVLPWHFKNEILKREKKMRLNGTKFIFPLPNLKVL
jgi:hypothetical protein